MSTEYLLFLLLVISFWLFLFADRQANLTAERHENYTLPVYHGLFFSLSVMLPVVALIVLWLPISSWLLAWRLESLFVEHAEAISPFRYEQILAVSEGLVPAADALTNIAAAYVNRFQTVSSIALSVTCALVLAAGCWRSYPWISQGVNARKYIEMATHGFLVVCGVTAITITLGIVGSILVESLRFFSLVSPSEFFTGVSWLPHSSETPRFGILPLMNGTLLVAVCALMVAVPVGLFVGIYIGEYAGSKTQTFIRPMIETLAGIPTVVYGFVAVFTLAPLISNAAQELGYSVSGGTALVAGLALGVMITPYVSSLTADVIRAVPNNLREASLALGATQSETIRYSVIPVAMPGILSGILLAASKAIGETMIVVMAAGLTAQLTVNPLDPVTTLTAQIVTLLTSNQTFDSAQTLAAFALGLSLLSFTMCLNIYALRIDRRYRSRLLRGFYG